jgi:hypothetical protein
MRRRARAGLAPGLFVGQKLPEQFHEEAMAKICWKLTAAIGLLVFSQLAAAALDGRAAIFAGDSAYRLAQASEPAAPAAAPPADSNATHDQPPPATTPPPNPTSTTEVTRPAKTVPGCALKYMAAEVAGKLKGRKWKEFRREECGETTTEAVFPATVAPKYSGEKPDKARTLTCADQFNANKATNANGGMKWIETSGGYYSECVSRLKG